MTDPRHDLTFTSHQHIGPGVHRLTAECSCGRTYKTTSMSDLRGRNNLRDQHGRHLKEVGKS